ncbi:hypothetical protein [Streptomyces sp. PsTaAH-124]|uniref:hypothetical protein n=1 Tax=Streptomyces sp. PsTaAH-124 TaxID=1157638 RepID=UPI00035F9F7F|nr:hypothetical protein [Streptomyces sp. PsTaAH-124]EYT81167.1 hypothetical protein CF54_21125 [Streptomyces sp. Tu 6176]
MSLSKRVTGTALAVAALTGLGLAGPVTAHATTTGPAARPGGATDHVAVDTAGPRAAGACWDAGMKVDLEVIPHEAYYCRNTAPTAVYGGPNYLNQVGTLNTSTSWFVCRDDGGAPNGETGPHPTRWLYVVADSPHGKIGWVPDKHIISETDPVEPCWQP